MTPDELSHNLRHGSSRFLKRRRGAVGASIVGMASLSVIAFYQIGLIPHLPDPPLPGFDADKVHSSAKAYIMLAVPDASIGLGSYAVTAMLAAMGRPDRATTQPWIPLLSAGKVAFDLLQVARLSWNELTEQRALSMWSLVTAAATGMTAVQAAPEAYAACRYLSTGWSACRAETCARGAARGSTRKRKGQTG